MKKIVLIDKNYSGAWQNTRTACRAVIRHNGKFLMSYERNAERLMTPGGGIEEGETPEECCIREVIEETGYIVKPVRELLTIEEYKDIWKWVNVYFLCEITGITDTSLTDREVVNGAETVWMEWPEIENKIKDWAAFRECDYLKSGIHEREYTVFHELLANPKYFSNTVIFDLDGTLIDTEKYYRKCWPQAAKDCGYDMTDEMALELRSFGRPFSPRRFAEWYGSEEAYHKIRARRTELVDEIISKEGISFKEGAVETLKWLKENGFTVAMSTANGEEKTKSILQKLDILKYFDKVICATMVKEGKPAPDVYAYACRELGKEPSECFAVEDSPNGVISAYRAGCRVIMVPDQTEPDEELMKMIDVKAGNLTDIISLFSE